MAHQIFLDPTGKTILNGRDDHLDYGKLNKFCMRIFTTWMKRHFVITWLFSARQISMKKKNTAQSCDVGIFAMVWGYTTNIRPGPEKYSNFVKNRHFAIHQRDSSRRSYYKRYMFIKRQKWSHCLSMQEMIVSLIRYFSNSLTHRHQ